MDVSPQQYNEWRETAVNTLLELPPGKDTTYEELSPATEQMMPLAEKEGWLRMEWFLNVKPEGETDEMDGVEMTDSNSRVSVGRSQGLRTGGSDYIGLGTMMQDATDYLGERQREDYQLWRAQIMARVQQLQVT